MNTDYIYPETELVSLLNSKIDEFCTVRQFLHNMLDRLWYSGNYSIEVPKAELILFLIDQGHVTSKFDDAGIPFEIDMVKANQLVADLIHYVFFRE